MYDIRNLNIWKKMSNPRKDSEYLQGDISELNLSVRSYNCLKRAGCNTIGDILKLTEDDENGLRKIRNLGSRSEAEILENIKQYKEQFHGRETEAEPSTVIRRQTGVSSQTVWNSSIEDYAISVNAMTCLKQSGIRQVKDLYRTDPKNEPGWYAVRELIDKLPVINV